ncbi:MAG: hypothetical protein DI551_09055 [Micavibrio aeruginosavorus]|uniref:Sensory/regulatory protein RpfC n=1 Tax=Micavibrio aeruginosavorus TaxID=349221 RepID=A0A2W5MVW1_9BACT|nr:MAG: hypothetical protein DI551_09055 [Micavibrio aeruginosavorus]
MHEQKHGKNSTMERLYQFFSSDFSAPHGFCFRWLPEILWLHIIADALIALSYFSIPLALWRFARKRPDMPFNKIFILFATFITLCGLTHVFGIFVLWQPYYGPEGLLMLATGIVSATTAILVWRILPSAITLPSPSELAEMNRKLSQSYEEIEQKVRDRTLELESMNADLIEARQKADEGSQAKSEFLANMSHEIRTPMNVVIGISDILAHSDPLTEQQKNYIQTLKSNANSLLNLINDVLDISKIESSLQVIESVPFNLYDTLEEVGVVMAIKAEEKGLDFIVEQPEPQLRTRYYLGDPHRIRQIMVNLCSNAIKFTDHGRVSIGLTRRGGNRDVEMLSLCVSDTGIGVAADKQRTIFEKFVQADNSINRKYGGTGLGLAITKTLVEAMGGTVDLESTAGQGAVFVVTLPLTVTQAPVLGSSEKTEPAPEKGASRQSRILLVEDYEPNVFVAEALLNRFGFTCETASNGIQAIEKRLTGDYDLILMDVQMPGKSGFEATQEIRRLELSQKLKKVPIIGMTAHAYAADREKCLSSGMDDYIAKPYDPEELRSKINALLKG